MDKEEILKELEELKLKRIRKKQKLMREIELETGLKRIDEAEVVGLEYIKRIILEDGKKGNYCLYRFPSCGHEQKIQATHVRRNNFKCEQCFRDNNSRLAREKGLSFIKEVSQGRSLYEYNDCGHEQTIYHGNITTGSFTCKTCYEDRLRKEANQTGLYTYIGKYDGCGIKRRYLINSCGHIKDSHPNGIRKKNLVCRVCQEYKYKEEAGNQGLYYNGESKEYSQGNKRNYILPCGCKKDLRINHVREGRWCCENCDETYYNKPSNIYLIEIKTEDFSWLKLGFAKDIKSRTHVYQIKKDFEYEELYLKPYSTAYEAMESEKIIHKKFKEFKYSPDLMKEYMTNGHTECYPLSLKEVLIESIKRD